MLQHAPLGYPTPPASPTYDDVTSCLQPACAVSTSQPRCVPPSAEDRLGRLVDSNLHLSEILGTGAYGVVYTAVDVNTGIRYAVKCLSKFNADGSPLEQRQIAYQQREIRLHYLASAHLNVVSLLKVIDAPDCTYVVLEYCPEGDLFLNITELGHYVGKDQLVKKVFLQILDAVEHCHKLGIYHRDLKPENILVTDHGDIVKLADFGLATSDNRSQDYGCGSTFYMSPECLVPSVRKPYYMCAPNDVWSLGVILVNLTCGHNPWKQASCNDSAYRAYARSPDFLKTILPLSDALSNILARVFDPNPERRVTLPELRCMILTCADLTVPAVTSVPMPVSPPATPLMPLEYLPADTPGAFEYQAPSSPTSTFDDDASFTSDAPVLYDMDAAFLDQGQHMLSPDASPGLQRPLDVVTAPAARGLDSPMSPQQYASPATVSPLAQVALQAASYRQMHAPLPLPLPGPAQPSCQSKLFLWEVFKCVQQAPLMQHPPAFHQQVSFMPPLQGCY